MRIQNPVSRRLSLAMLCAPALFLSACLHESDEKYSVGGTVTGLSGTVVLRNNGGDDLGVSANGGFTFSRKIKDGKSYEVTVATQPAGQACTVTGGAGDVDGDDVTNVAVACVSVFTLSGTIAATAGSAVDGDLNDPNASYVSNDTFGAAQAIGNPVTVGGFASTLGTGFAGDRFSSVGDKIDIYSVALATGQNIALYIGDYNTGAPKAVDLDLYLVDPSDTTVPVAASEGTGDAEAITVVTAGTYYVIVSAYSGLSNYTLVIGAAPARATTHDLKSTDDFVPGEVIVQFKDTALPAGSGADALRVKAAALGLEAKGGALGRPALFHLPGGAARSEALQTLGVGDASGARLFPKVADPGMRDKLETLSAVKALRARADVLSADLNYIRKAYAVPNDEYYRYQWHYPLINLPQAWDVTTGSPNVIVAVIDTGVFLTHPDLIANLTTGYDFISSTSISNDGTGIDSNPDDPGDSSIAGQSSWHGTHVAGTIAAVSNNSIGVAGIARNAKVMPLRALGKGGGTSYDIMQSVRYAARLSNDSNTLPAQRADIINLSLGGYGSSQAEQDTYTAARNAGVIIIAAAGNENTSQLSYPASYNGVVSVSAVDLNKNRAPYSNFGTTVDVAAPGGDSSKDRNGDGYGDGVLSTLVSDSSGTRQPVYNFYQGTSMACPHVAGVAALMVAVRKTASSTLTPSEFDTFLASGSITNDLGDAGRDNIFGYGLIDAFKAVQAASTSAPTALAVNPTSLNFGTLAGASSSLAVLVDKSGTGNISVTNVASSAAWLNVAATSVDGSGLGTYTATASKGSLADGTYSATITFTTANPSSTVQVSVNMRIGAAVSADANAGYLYLLVLNPESFEVAYSAELTASNGQYTFSIPGVAAGEYFIVAGSDMDNDVYICDEAEACGAYPTLGLANKVTVSSHLSELDFDVGFMTGIGTNAAGGTPPLKFSRATGKRVAPH
jgi:serine protease